MRWMLLVDTCGAQGSVGVATLNGDDLPVLVAERALPGRETQERLMRELSEVLGKASIAIENIDVLAVVTGPGSFTGVRIGLAAVKGLAEALGKPVVALSRLAVLAAQSKKQGIVQAWIEAGRGEIFVGRYKNGSCLSEGMKRGADASQIVADAEAVVLMEETLVPFYPAAALVLPIGVREVLTLAWERFSAGEFADIALLDANYLRVPDAELARKATENRA